MMIHQPINFDAERWLQRGMHLAVETADKREATGRVGVMWALLVEAAEVSRSWQAPPRSGHASRSTLPEGPDLLSEWERRNLDYAEGVTIGPGYSRRTEWSAEQHSHAEATLALYHAVALMRSGDRQRLRRAVFAHALGMPPRKIRALFGLSRFQLSRAKARAMEDMAEQVIGG